MLERICHELCKIRVHQFAAAEDGIHSWRNGAKITHTDIHVHYIHVTLSLLTRKLPEGQLV